MEMNYPRAVRLENEAFFTWVAQQLEQGDQVWIPVQGKSMQPFLRERDKVLLKRVGIAEIAIGDMVLARWAQGYVLHRVIRKDRNALWLVGNNNLAQIEKIAAADLIATVVEVRRAERPVAVCNTFNKNLGILWYYLRWPRRVVAAVRRQIWK